MDEIEVDAKRFHKRARSLINQWKVYTLSLISLRITLPCILPWIDPNQSTAGSCTRCSSVERGQRRAFSKHRRHPLRDW